MLLQLRCATLGHSNAAAAFLPPVCLNVVAPPPLYSMLLLLSFAK